MDTKGCQVSHQHQVKGCQAGWKLFLESSLRRRASGSGTREAQVVAPQDPCGHCEHPWDTLAQAGVQALGMVSPESAEGSKVVLL